MPKESKKGDAKVSRKKTEGTKKRKKDPNAPKRPLSAYMLFSQEKRKQVLEENPDVKFTEVGKLLGAMWKELSEEEKKIYNDKASKDKERYEREKADYTVGPTFYSIGIYA
ncbi:uncharacterized protein VTP21DRAFT_5710 [Calcarisporiella thermophila]|uniref:uncharacterized protein n=1 Tax=Calcarisporiella thermophila TaxID=911321 RepID=UPI00374394D9